MVKEAELAIGEDTTGVEEGRGGGRYSENDRRFENVVCHVCGQKGRIWARCEEAKKKLFLDGMPSGR